MQKIPTFLYNIIFPLGLLWLVSCSSASGKDKAIIKELENNIQKSNVAINLSTTTYLKVLQDKMTEVCTKQRAEIWLPKAEFISQKTKKIFDNIETLKLNDKVNDSSWLNLFYAIKKYEENILSTDSQLKEIFEMEFQFINKSISLLGGDTTAGTSILKKQVPHTSALPLLISLQNNIKIIENKTIVFCNTKVGCMGGWLDYYYPLISQSHSVIKVGEKLEINAGIGIFSTAVQPKITINGKLYNINEEGVSVCKLKTPAKPGTYSVPVTISYFNQIIGKEEVVQTNVKYTVAKPCDQ